MHAFHCVNFIPINDAHFESYLNNRRQMGFAISC